jgi:hypothetical protein
MGTMHIEVDARVGDKQCNFAFNWKGDEAAISDTMAAVERFADEAEVTPEAFTQGILRHLPSMGAADEQTRQVTMMAIRYVILSLPTQSPDRPGALYNYAGREQITAAVEVRDDGVHVEIKGHRFDA